MKILKLLCLALLLGGMASCSSDEPENPKTFPAGTFTDQSGLKLTVNGEPMLGKTAAFAPEGENGKKGTVTLSSSFDMSVIPGINNSQVIAGPSVIPGSKELTLHLNLKKDGNSKSKFSGSDETKYCTFKYKGTVSEGAFVLEITDLKLKDEKLVAAWKPAPYEIVDDWESEDYGNVLSNPVYYTWESSSDMDFLGSPLPISDLLKLLMSMPLLNDMTQTVPEALIANVEAFDFRNDGNIIASYADQKSTAEVKPWIKSPANVAQYVVAGNDKLLFFLNPQAIMAAETKSLSRAINFDNILGNVLGQLVPMMGDGVPMRYALNGNEMRVYLDTQVLLPLLKSVEPMLRDEAFVNQIVEMAKQDESMGFIADMLPGMISSVADVIKNTTKIEIGLDLRK